MWDFLVFINQINITFIIVNNVPQLIFKHFYKNKNILADVFIRFIKTK